MPAATACRPTTTTRTCRCSPAVAVRLYFAARRRKSEVVIVAADKDQAKDRVFRSVVYAVEHNPAWGKAKVFKDVIELDNGSTITALPFDWKGSAGGNPSGVIMDELHTFTTELQRRMYDELVIPPTQRNGVRWIASYAGFEGESTLLQEIWNRARGGERLAGELPIYHAAEASLLALIDQGKESWRMPWSTAAAMRQIEASERPPTFRRLWLNEWVSSESQFLPEGTWGGLYNPDVLPLLPGDKRPIVLGADASTSRDLTALVGVTFDPLTQRADVVYCRVWKPKFSLLRNKATVDLSATIGAEIARLYQENTVRAVYYDPYQLHSISIDLQKKGVPMVELPQTGARVEADQALYDDCIGGAMRHYNDPTLNEHVQNPIALETHRGL